MINQKIRIVNKDRFTLSKKTETLFDLIAKFVAQKKPKLTTKNSIGFCIELSNLDFTDFSDNFKISDNLFMINFLRKPLNEKKKQ